MAEKKPLNYVLHERKMSIGPLKGKSVLYATPSGRRRVSHRTFCEMVALATTFTSGEIQAVLQHATAIAKRLVENGDSVDFGDLGVLTPTFKSAMVEKGKEKFNAGKHLKNPKILLRPNATYFALTGVKYERVSAKGAADLSAEDATPQEGGSSSAGTPNEGI